VKKKNGRKVVFERSFVQETCVEEELLGEFEKKRVREGSEGSGSKKEQLGKTKKNYTNKEQPVQLKETRGA